ncbi:MAG: phosphomannomutase/phosphoglucomutase, partial [Oscillospiraceae bacterium]|nr:phosphomannomutase/phosphoglucomutase [Oscillospiraceae bacterium]
ITSTGLAKFIEEKGGVHHRFKRGYRNVINESIRLNNEGISSPLAMETSGHGALRENYFLDDGAYLSAKMVIQAARLRKQGKTLADMLAGMGEPAEAAELRFKIAGENFGDYGRGVVADLLTYAQQQNWQIAPDNHEGVRVAFDGEGMVGWLLLRLSLHDPIMPLNIESDDLGGVKKIAAQLLPFLQKYDRLDISALTKLLA